ncbi:MULTISPECIES: aspartate aminotransferase family protein [Vibrio]|uniref:Aminotransferase class III-fold pyridoxal phosphate-dependent enzyme n=2 Tax=Vibrio TaxID=662 RepID=A0A7X4LN33_9VIBR|nr:MULTISPECIES: aspartate aminotransferase family protein [Vibrio]MBF9002264.1 aspartate aminotransferase family protein [Vibrio nitrifigilis]MZI94954.1 aminotransferase class III-fold pyridoxal phosphate-dependent enzyme [Vibrio eleionomae]
MEMGANTANLMELKNQNVPRGLVNAHPVAIETASGTELWDVDGQRYLDFVGGIGVLNVGHSHPAVVKAVNDQLGKISHPCAQVAIYEPYIKVAQELNALVGKGKEQYKTVLLSSGAEAVENAVKIARGYTNRPAVISFRGGFHGRTLLGSTLTGMSAPYKQNFGPLAAEVYHTVYPNEFRGITSEDALDALNELFLTDVTPDRVAAIIIESVQGDGGFLQAPTEFMQALRDITTEHGIVLICDEIQAGFGRTGTMFGYEHTGVQPDLVTTAKSLAGGLPLSAVVGKADIMDGPLPGGLGGTYGGNALACAAALAVIDLYKNEDLLDLSRRNGEFFKAGLNDIMPKFKEIADVRGAGFMLAMELTKGDDALTPDADITQSLIDACRAEGLLVIKCGTYRNAIRFLPPVNTPQEQLIEALSMLERACKKVLTAQ